MSYIYLWNLCKKTFISFLLKIFLSLFYWTQTYFYVRQTHKNEYRSVDNAAQNVYMQ